MFNEVPQIVTQINENTYPLTTTIDAPFVEVTSVNGMTGDVIVNIILGSFTPNYYYQKGAAIIYNSGLYYAKDTFTSGDTFDIDDWDFPVFVQEQADWTENDTSSNSYIKHKPTLAQVATSGQFADLSGTENVVEDADYVHTDNNYTDIEKTKLSGIENGAQVNPTTSALVDLFYPVGSYYETSDTTFDPNVAWGGTWVEDTKGRATVAKADSGTFATLGGTGGSETVTISSANLPTHTHTYDKASTTTGAATGNTGSTTLTTNQIPAHYHTAGRYDGYIIENKIATDGGGGNSNNCITVNTGSTTSSSRISTNNTGGGQGHTHTLNSHTHSITNSSTNSGNGGFANTAMNNLQPYIVVKRWHRTA